MASSILHTSILSGIVGFFAVFFFKYLGNKFQTGKCYDCRCVTNSILADFHSAKFPNAQIQYSFNTVIIYSRIIYLFNNSKLYIDSIISH